jgi:antitoxin VapB
MDTARLFQSGRSQAVRLPKEYRFSGGEVAIRHFGNGVLLMPIDDPWGMLVAGLAAFEPGFSLTREQPEQQVRSLRSLENRSADHHSGWKPQAREIPAIGDGYPLDFGGGVEPAFTFKKL